MRPIIDSYSIAVGGGSTSFRSYHANRARRAVLFVLRVAPHALAAVRADPNVMSQKSGETVLDAALGEVGRPTPAPGAELDGRREGGEELLRAPLAAAPVGHPQPRAGRPAAIAVLLCISIVRPMHVAVSGCPVGCSQATSATCGVCSKPWVAQGKPCGCSRPQGSSSRPPTATCRAASCHRGAAVLQHREADARSCLRQP